jgi:GxxExxY protein
VRFAVTLEDKQKGPRMDANIHELDLLVKTVVGAAYEVSNVLGAGFLEKVYERALVQELVSRGLNVRSQASFPVGYKGQCVGDYVADLLIEEQLIVELKCVDQFSKAQGGVEARRLQFLDSRVCAFIRGVTYTLLRPSRAKIVRLRSAPQR